MSSLLFLCSAAFLGSCGAPLPTDVGSDPAVQAATVPTTAREGCAQVEVTLSGRGGVTTRFPAPEACDGGLVLVAGGEPRYDRSGGGTLELPMAVSNGTGSEMALPARLLLLPDSAVVLFPSGLQGRPNQQIAARGADGTAPEGEPWAGAWRWDIGEEGTLGAGAQSAPRALAFTVPNGVQRFRLAFRVEAEQAALDTIWPVLTGSGPMLDTTRVVAQSDEPDATVYFRTEFTIRFEDGVTNAAKAAFFARYSMRVLGVMPLTGWEIFYVRVPDPGPSIDAYLALMDSLQRATETGSVLPLFRSGGIRPTIHSRFPVDGASQVRMDWLDETSGTWAMRAVRVPLAWGCETGAYGGSVVRVGVVEWKHQGAHPDYSLSTPRLWEPPDGSLLAASGRVLPPDSVVSAERHAAATTGLLTAQGDNEKGLAGMMWRSDLHLYAGASAGDLVPQLFAGWLEQAKAIVSDDVRILSLSAFGALGKDLSPGVVTRATADLALLLRTELLDLLPNLLIVVAAGNRGFEGTPDTYIRPGSAAELGALLRLREDAAYRDRIIVVAGTRPGNALWSLSNRFTGLTDIAAPAENVTVLDRWDGPGTGVGLRVASGTSFSAPLVAGTAGLLLSMDPTLTAAEVKDYIVRGAASPRYRAETGLIEPPPEVSGLPGVRQLDAYGALSLLSHERKGTPLCGVSVSVLGDELTVHRDSVPGGETHSVAGATRLGLPSVAQGGRRIAMSEFDSRSVFVVDPKGQVIHTRTDLHGRQYLERDTADITLSDTPWGGLELRLTGPKGTYTTQMLQDIDANQDAVVGLVSVSPDAERIGFSAVAVRFLPDATVGTFGIYVKDRDQTGFSVVEQRQCTDLCGGFEWSALPTLAWGATSEAFVVTVEEDDPESEDVRTRLLRVSRSGAVEAGHTLADRLAWTSGINADMTLFESWESNDAQDICARTERTVTPLGFLRLTQSVGDPARCRSGGPYAARTNAPATRIVVGNLDRPGGFEPLWRRR